MDFDMPSETGKHYYEVLNLYLDSPSLKFYREKVNGLMFRKKLRFRFYTFEPPKSQHVYLEIKRKKNMTIIKDRIKLPFNDGIKVLEKDFSHILNTMRTFAKQQEELFSEFVFETLKNRLHGKLWVLYHRTPLSSRSAPRLRVTFDDNPIAVKAHDGFNFDIRRTHHHLFRNKSVVEIKYSGSLPFWLHEIIQKYELFREPISKYCNAIERIIL